MKTKMQRTHRAVALLVLPLAAACATVGYAVPGELSSVSAQPVSGRQGWQMNQRISFGAYSTDAVKRSFTRGREGDVGFATDRGEYRQSYEFALNRGGSPVANVRCEAEGSGAQTLNVVWRSKRVLKCDVNMAAGGLRTIDLGSSRDQPLSGRVAGNPSFAVTGSNRTTGGPVIGTAGYTIAEEGGAAVAAVDVTSSGAVMMRGGEDDAVAAVAAALLLYQDPLEASERFRN